MGVFSGDTRSLDYSSCGDYKRIWGCSLGLQAIIWVAVKELKLSYHNGYI